MPDWSSTGAYDPPKAMITTKSAYQDAAGMTNSAMNIATTWQSVNRAVFAPFYVQQQVTIYQMAIEITTTGGNCDIGIYSMSLVRLVSTGSTVTAAAGIQVFNITDTVLTPGTYFAALSFDGVTAAIRAASGSTTLAAMAGVRQQATGFVLPATATVATATASMWPYIAMATNPTTI
jgi:hypothetical protein